jgi:tRNA(fMet)-specific endonuclease VapC
MAAVLLDTDILSEVFKQRDAVVTQHAAAYIQAHRQFTVSAFSRFEVRRGYLSKQATKQLALFDVFCGHCQVLPITDSIFDRASQLWAYARQHGYPCGDADVVIAATALEHGISLATGNLRHFGWVPDLVIEDWRML